MVIRVYRNLLRWEERGNLVYSCFLADHPATTDAFLIPFLLVKNMWRWVFLPCLSFTNLVFHFCRCHAPYMFFLSSFFSVSLSGHSRKVTLEMYIKHGIFSFLQMKLIKFYDKHFMNSILYTIH